jgi:beta-RFAP synthase
MPRSVVVQAPSRLHFGLFALASTSGRQFGGVGAMVAQPSLRLRISAAATWQVDGPLAPRVETAAERWCRFHDRQRPACRVAVDEAPPEHVGLGVGTQLALGVAAGLSAFCGLPASAPQELALSVDRGLRSAVGTYGFALGGLIVERGKLPGEPISPLDTRLALPAMWRFVLVRPIDARGLCGELESAAMDQTPVPAETTEKLIGEVRDQLVPAVARGDFEAFAASLDRYCRQAGSFYVRQQGGIYNGPVLTALAERIRAWGHVGVGQSSWGPTLFVAQRDAGAAGSLAQRLRREWDDPVLDVVVAEPSNTGAQVTCDDSISAPVR